MLNAKITALSDNHCVAALRCDQFRCWGVQFHPEVQHTNGGNDMLFNFVTKCCGLKPNTWTDTEQLIRCSNTIVESVDMDDRVILGLSGGVDSAVVAALLGKPKHFVFVSGPNLLIRFVNFNGGQTFNFLKKSSCVTGETVASSLR